MKTPKEWTKKLDESKTYGQIFEIVKETVEQVLNRRRAGLSLALEELPGGIGAYHSLGSNFLVLNKRLLDAFQVMGKTKVERNSLTYSLLLHEYLHSLGLPDEGTVRKLVFKISSECFGEKHAATKLALGGPWAQHPELSQLPPGSRAYLVPGLDEETKRYIA